MAKESPKPKSDSKMSKKEEKKKKKEMKKSKESLDQVGSSEIEPATPRTTKKKEKKAASPGKDSVGSSGKKKGLFKRIGSFMLPPPALAASPPAQLERINISQSCQDLGKSGGSPRGGKRSGGTLGSPHSAGSNSASSPNLLAPPSTSPPAPPITTSQRPHHQCYPPIPPLQPTTIEAPSSENYAAQYKTLLVNMSPDGISCRVRTDSTMTMPDQLTPLYGGVTIAGEELLGNQSGGVTTAGEEMLDNQSSEEESEFLYENGVSCLVKSAGKYEMKNGSRRIDDDKTEVNYEVPSGRPFSRDAILSDSVISVEYAVPLKSYPVSSDEEDSPRRSSMKNTPSPRKERHISFAEEEDGQTRVLTPEILKRNLAAELAVPLPPNTSYTEDVIDIPEPCDLDGLPLDERCQQQSRLLSVYEEKIHHFRDQVLLIVSENSRLQKLCSQRGVHDIESLQKQAQQVLQENRTLIKEQQMNEARWHDLIEERNQEVVRMRATCTNLEEQNSTLVKRCDKWENRNEEIREAYNAIVTQADDFVPVSAHLSSMEGYKVALEELRRRYDDNVHEKNEDIATLETTVTTLSERVEGVEEENSILIGQVKGLREALEKAQHNSTKHKREAINLTQRVNTLKSSLAQAIAIAEESTLHKLEVAEISELQDQQNRSQRKINSDHRVKEVKKIANAKLKSCAEILQERESEHERSITKLNERITKLKMRCQNKDDIIQSFSTPDHTVTPNESC